MTVPIDPRLRRLVQEALREDGARQDITSRAIPWSMRAVAEIVAEQDMIVSGTAPALMAFRLCDPRVRVLKSVRDGRRVGPGRPILRVKGRARSLLSAERTALNFLSRLCGVATLTRRFVDAVPAGARARARARARILDTRKTTPLLRHLEKSAVAHGGGKNHRMTLSEAVLLKDNHVLLLGGVLPAIRAVRRRLGKSVEIEVEVKSFAELREALSEGAGRVLLDNMTDRQVRRAMRMVGGRAKVEVSGGVGLDRISRLARLGVDYISVGALTHSALAAKISMDVRRA
ncbi:MAG: nicotinate-nucleotide diphosphorylase (carboxylating) [Candidatus Lindowbacteria bacterium RIFCSPLOWO2_12_FULL_62_27]|nr:MAG: nicotinate-nucleotide diphosphorylase (carboxylating) [Candidatus Lindowbacteria bacterium RIFCSPLOWO2_12_FULL_62_27]OGH62830.1 MAG: nicotinate-nucleotide diphosphorylase (carboxylating) [Candidatus Lindowbacteria bacterium RIFCSPLOWO2_02_FULL_62_12]